MGTVAFQSTLSDHNSNISFRQNTSHAKRCDGHAAKQREIVSCIVLFPFRYFIIISIRRSTVAYPLHLRNTFVPSNCKTPLRVSLFLIYSI